MGEKRGNLIQKWKEHYEWSAKGVMHIALTLKSATGVMHVTLNLKSNERVNQFVYNIQTEIYLKFKGIY